MEDYQTQVSMMRLLWLPHRAYNSILSENPRLRCQDARKYIFIQSIKRVFKWPFCEQSVKIYNNSALVVRYITKLVQKTSS